MRVEMRRCAPRQPLEPLQLAVDLGRHRRRVVGVDALVAQQPLAVAKLPLGQVDVQAQRQPRDARLATATAAAAAGCAHHQAGAGDDAVHVAVQDALVDAVGQAEVVGVDDQRPHRPSRSTSRAHLAAPVVALLGGRLPAVAPSAPLRRQQQPREVEVGAPRVAAVGRAGVARRRARCGRARGRSRRRPSARRGRARPGPVPASSQSTGRIRMPPPGRCTSTLAAVNSPWISRGRQLGQPLRARHPRSVRTPGSHPARQHAPAQVGGVVAQQPVAGRRIQRVQAGQPAGGRLPGLEVAGLPQRRAVQQLHEQPGAVRPGHRCRRGAGASTPRRRQHPPVGRDLAGRVGQERRPLQLARWPSDP